MLTSTPISNNELRSTKRFHRFIHIYSKTDNILKKQFSSLSFRKGYLKMERNSKKQTTNHKYFKNSEMVLVCLRHFRCDEEKLSRSSDLLEDFCSQWNHIDMTPGTENRKVIHCIKVMLFTYWHKSLKHCPVNGEYHILIVTMLRFQPSTCVACHISCLPCLLSTSILSYLIKTKRAHNNNVMHIFKNLYKEFMF